MLVTVALVAGNLVALVAGTVEITTAAADTAPVDPARPETVSAAALPTVQINGVVWSQVIAGNRVYATGRFTSARPAGSPAGSNETTRSNILAYDLTTGALVTSWAPTLNSQGLSIKASADGSTIFVGGDFDRVNNVTRSRIAALDAQTGALLPGVGASGANTRVAAIAVNGNTLYAGGYFTTFANQPRTRLAAVNATTGALLPWAPSADREVESMVVVPSTGKVIAGGNFNTLNGETNLGMGAIDGVSGTPLPWPVNTIIRNNESGAMISGLATDGVSVFGVGWAFNPQGANANFEGVFSANAETGAFQWMIGGRGDNYGVATADGVVYSVGHPHDWGMVDWNPELPSRSYQYAHAIDASPATTLTNAFGVGGNWNVPAGRPAGQPLHWLPTLELGNFTGQSQAAWSVATNGDYVVLGGEFPRVNGTNQQGLVRFAKREISPSVDTVQGASQLTPTLTAVGPGAVRLAWTAAWDRDNERLQVEVLRGGVVIKTFFNDKATWWNRQPLGFVDTTAPPGTSQSYRIRMTDPFGNGIMGNQATITIPSGTPPTSAYNDTVKADDPVWQWRLGETSGTLARDFEGSNDLTLNSGVVRNAAGALLNESNPSASFPGSTSTSTVQGATPFLQSGPQSFSLEAWVNTTTTTGGKIIGFGDSRTGRSTDNGNDRTLYMTSSGQIRFGVRPDMGTRQTINSPSTYRDGQWHHIVGTLSSAGMKLFIDGSLVASNSAVTKAQVYRGYWRVGGDNLGSWPSAPAREAITAQIDEVAVYPVALPVSRIEAHFTASGRVGPPPNVPPVASFTSSSQDLTATFTSTSNDSDGNISLTSWDFGDGTSSTGSPILHNYATAGTYPVTVTVTDNRGDVSSVTENVTVTGTSAALFAGDLFGRTVADDFGTADIGGQWTESGGSTSFSVAGGAGRIAGAINSDRAAFLVTAQRDIDETVDISIDRAATGGDAYVSLLGRRVANNTDFRLRMRYQSNGTLVAYLVRVVNNASTILAWTNVTGLNPTPGEVIRLRLQVDGSTSTTARAKVWRANATEPTAWLLTNTSAPPAVLQGPGDVGMLLYHSSAWSGTPATLAIDNLRVAPIGGVVLPPNVPPVASFTSTNQDLTATLTSTSTDPDGGSIVATGWNFGDSTSGSGSSTAHTYASAGTYPVTLTVTDNRGGSSSITQDVTVTDPPPNIPPLASFTSTVQNLTATLTSTSTDPDGGSIVATGWSFGDGSSGSGSSTAHTYASAGTYPVTLTVTDNRGGSSSITQDVIVTDPPPNIPPVASFTSTVQNLTATLTSTSTDQDGTITTRSWNFGDSTTGSGASVSHTYAGPGTYPVTHTVTDNRGDSSSITQNVTVTAPTVFASDLFGRTVANGFGTADLGGSWTLVGAATSFSVNGGTGRIAGAVGSNRSVFLTGVAQRDIDETVDVSIDRAASGSGAYVSLVGRRASNNNDYRLRLRYQSNNTLVAYLVRVSNNSDTILAWTNVTGITPSPGDVFRMRLQVTGGATTTARAKVWRATAVEPTAWLLTGTDTPPAALQGNGAVGVIHYHSSTWSGAASILTLDNFNVAPIP